MRNVARLAQAGKSPQHGGVVPQDFNHHIGDEVVAVGCIQRYATLGRGSFGNEREQSGETVEKCLPGTGGTGETESQQVAVLGCEQVMAGFGLVRRDGCHDTLSIPGCRKIGPDRPSQTAWT